jgi:hypothetical protein
MADETYDEGRAQRLVQMLRLLADRIRWLDARDQLLPNAAELQKLLGDVRSELFHYEVKATYDTPEIAENRRIVSEASEPDEESWRSNPWTPDEDEDRPA